MRQFIAEIPDSLIEAARTDCAIEVSIYLRVIVLLSTTGILTPSVLCFTDNYNESAWPLLINNTQKMYTLPTAVAFFEGMNSTNYTQPMAVAFIAMVPDLVIFFFLCKQFTQGIVMSGLKE